jgi:hypothetical protein
VTADTVEADAIERVALLIDESANLVWGIEQVVSDGVGGGMDGHDAARRVAKRLQSTGTPCTRADVHRYVLGTTVPENWIPFVPVHKQFNTRATRLQRASMLRFRPTGVTPVRPQTDLLRVNVASDDLQKSPYFVNEEEVPRGGLVIHSAWRRARWHDGQTFVWLGRKKRSGAGEGGSGLRFDVLLDPKGL